MVKAPGFLARLIFNFFKYFKLKLKLIFTMPRSQSVESTKSRKDIGSLIEPIDPFLVTFDSEFPSNRRFVIILGGII